MFTTLALLLLSLHAPKPPFVLTAEVAQGLTIKLPPTHAIEVTDGQSHAQLVVDSPNLDHGIAPGGTLEMVNKDGSVAGRYRLGADGTWTQEAAK